MTTVNNLRKTLHRKAWEMLTPTPTNSAAGTFVAGDKGGLMPANDCNYVVLALSTIYNYNADQDSWLQIPASGIAGTFASGACGEFRALGMLGGAVENTATAGTTNSLTTNRTIVRELAGCAVQVVAGTGVGYKGTVASTRFGANSVLMVTPANGVAFDATTVFRIWSGALWFFCPSTTAPGFAVYDRATNAWTQKTVTGLPTSWGTCGQLVCTGSIEGSVETGTSTGINTGTTLNNTGKNWQTNAYVNAQLRISAGTGNGQIRQVASNTSTALTVSAAWTVTPDATSVYSLEGNDDALYLLGNATVTLYKYSIAGNTWATVTPGSARNTAMSAGGTADWINGVPAWATAVTAADSSSTTTFALYKQNGRYIYSLRGGGSSGADIYDIALNTWYGLAYGNQTETFNTGSCSVDLNGYIYIKKDATGRMFRFDVANNVLEPWAHNLYPESTVIEGDKLFTVIYRDAGVTIPFIYGLQHSRAELMRMMVIG